MIEFDNEYRLAYHCQRKLGLIGLCDDPAFFIERRGLGPDALDRMLDRPALERAMTGRRATVKSWLMDQGTIAGIGNVYADEILFHARIHPARRIDGLTRSEVDTLHRALRSVLDQAIEARADPTRMPTSFLLPHRSSSGRCPRCGNALSWRRIAGRTAYYCPACQPCAC